jgi:hypothetical protein
MQAGRRPRAQQGLHSGGLESMKSTNLPHSGSEYACMLQGLAAALLYADNTYTELVFAARKCCISQM